MRNLRRDPVSRARPCGGPGAPARGEAGFTLVEVVVSMLLIAIVMSAALQLFLRSMGSADVQGQRQQAVALGTDQLEELRALPVTTLLENRTQAMVDALWASPGPVNTSQSVKVWDTSSPTGAATVPTTRTVTVDNVVYTVRTFVDACYLPSSAAACGTSSTGATVMYRLAVGVTWTPGGGRRCSTSTGDCSYVVSTLRDPSTNPTFNTN